MAANETQVGGAHYRAKIQHWDYVIANDLNYFEGQITKYVTRCRKKNGLQDLEKARHFLDKYIEAWDGMAKMRLEGTEDGDIKARKVEEVSWYDETAARAHYTVEGYRSDGKELFKCKHCGAEGWGVLAMLRPVQHTELCFLGQDTAK